MNAHVLLNLIKELRKEIKWEACLPSILSFFRDKFNKFNNIRTGMLYSIYHMALSLL